MNASYFLKAGGHFVISIKVVFRNYVSFKFLSRSFLAVTGWKHFVCRLTALTQRFQPRQCSRVKLRNCNRSSSNLLNKWRSNRLSATMLVSLVLTGCRRNRKLQHNVFLALFLSPKFRGFGLKVMNMFWDQSSFFFVLKIEFISTKEKRLLIRQTKHKYHVSYFWRMVKSLFRFGFDNNYYWGVENFYIYIDTLTWFIFSNIEVWIR